MTRARAPVVAPVLISISGMLAAMLLFFTAGASSSVLIVAAVPALLLTFALAETAAAILIGVVFVRARQASLFVLCATEIVTAIFHVHLFVRSAVSSPAAILRAGGAHGWPQSLFLMVVAIGIGWYTIERLRPNLVSPANARRAVAFGIPLIIVVTSLVCCAVRKPLDAPSPALALTVPAVLAATAFLAWAMRRRSGWVMDRAMLVASILVVIDAVITSTTDMPRPEWFLGKLLGLGVPAAIIIATVRFLLEQIGDEALVTAAQLRAEVDSARLDASTEAAILKSQFVATVSHELRTPLGGIVGMAELLERTPLSPAQQSFADAIRSSATSLMRIVNDLLDFSRSQSGRLELEHRPFSLTGAVEDVAVLFRVQAAQRGVSLFSFVDPTLPDTIYGDEVRLKQVLQNLVGNAVRFTSEGTIRIEVAATRGPRPEMRFTVADSGIGIPPAALARIFEPFQQADASTNRRFGGTGLGLAIAQHLVALMGGVISVSSTEGVGSAFTFTLPIVADAGKGDTQPLHDVQVLILESDATIATLLDRYTTAWGMRTHVAATIAAAQATVDRSLHDRPCDIVLLGPSIALEDAREFARRNRSHAGLAKSGWIAVRAGEHDQAPPGFDAVVPGPLRQSKLFDAIMRVRRSEMTGVRDNATPPAARPFRDERILIAEDSEVNSLLLTAQLEHLGFRPDVVHDGAGAIERAVDGNYDLIFMDCQMPEVDGFEATRRIRARLGGERQVPIIAVTANVLPGYRDLCLAAGMNDYLAKPALLQPLTTIIDRWLPGSAQHDGAATTVAAVTPPDDDRAVRERLREIFGGDEARVEQMIGLAVSSLHEGIAGVDLERAQRDPEGAARAVHKLKGIALDIGFGAVAERARSLEGALRAEDWPAVAEERTHLAAAIDALATGKPEVPS